MKDSKCMYARFAFFDRTGIQNFLECQAKKGWLLKSMRSYIWRFQRIEPKTIHYAITYFSAKDGDLPLVEQKLLYLAMCEQSGWKLVDQFGYMQIFSNEDEPPTPIETDAVLEIETIHRAVKKEVLWFDCIQILLTSIFLKNEIDRYIFATKIGVNSSVFPIIFFILFLAWYFFDIGRYYIWRAEAKKAALLDGSFTKTRSYPVVSCLISGLLLIITVYTFFAGLFSNIKGDPIACVTVIILLLLLVGIAIWLFLYLNRETQTDKNSD